MGSTNGAAVAERVAPSRASVAPAELAGKRFDLSKLERLDTKAALAKFELERARLEEAQASYLSSIGRKVLERCGVALKDGDKIALAYRQTSEGVIAIEVLPEPAPADEAPSKPADPPASPAPAPAQ